MTGDRVDLGFRVVVDVGVAVVVVDGEVRRFASVVSRFSRRVQAEVNEVEVEVEVGSVTRSARLIVGGGVIIVVV